MRAAQAGINQLSQQLRFQQDRIVAEIQDAASALARYDELLDKARENATVARGSKRESANASCAARAPSSS
jgi:hypothetical protein